MTELLAEGTRVLENSAGLRARLTESGGLQSLECDNLVLTLFPGSEAEPGLCNVYLRQFGANPSAIPLLGPLSPSCFYFESDRLTAEGVFGDLAYRLSFTLDPQNPLWFWQVELENRGIQPIEFDLIHTQDLALSSYGAIRLNEYYVSQYLDHAILTHPVRGTVVATRQNLPIAGRNPWTLMGSTRKATSCATDALQFFGLEHRLTGRIQGLQRGLPNRRLQHEHALVALQDQAAFLAPGEVARAGFYGWLVEDHPEATSLSDLARVEQAIAAFDAVQPQEAPSTPTVKPPASLFLRAKTLNAESLDEDAVNALFGGERRETEWHGEALWSFFTDRRTHVVLKAKEASVLRPHGHLLRTGECFDPDETALTSTVYMNGVFHSLVTQGHVGINRFLSTSHSYLGLFNAHGLRLFVERDGEWVRLGVPSCFAMEPSRCRWWYRDQYGLIEIESTAEPGQSALGLRFRCLEGPPMRWLASLHVALGGDDGALSAPVCVSPDGHGIRVGIPEGSELSRRFPKGSFVIQPVPGSDFEALPGDAWLYADGKSRNEPYLGLRFSESLSGGLILSGNLITEVAPVQSSFDTQDAYWSRATAGLQIGDSATDSIRALNEILPWFAHNALIHFLSPRGLEQYSGGGWGTRDVAQGPVEYLLAINQPAAVRTLLLILFQHQNPDGDWPQWFMFFERDRAIRPQDSHGDIVFWPLLALGQYLEATGDRALLDVEVPYFEPEPSRAERRSLRDHVEKALALITSRLIPGTQLESYGHGDWNDSLQPADPSLREQLCSAWTVTLHFQTLSTLSRALREVGDHARSAALSDQAIRVKADFRQHLLVDGVIPGYIHFDQSGPPSYLLHPQDHTTGLRFSVLPMIHAVINHLLEPKEALAHLNLIRQHLSGPDGVHLFDRPMVYRGGPMRIFQRAETATFFGREIGLMYTHAHLRYAEALWQYGDPEGFFEALEKALPIGVTQRIKSAKPRQANCYFSSSDAAFGDRYEADAHYEQALLGAVGLEGGWRVYSSGAGIAAGLILRALFGLRASPLALFVDPMLPSSLPEVSVTLDLCDHAVAVRIQRGTKGFGPRSVSLNGEPLSLKTLENPYRIPGVRIDAQDFQQLLTPSLNQLEIVLS